MWMLIISAAACVGCFTFSFIIYKKMRFTERLFYESVDNNLEIINKAEKVIILNDHVLSINEELLNFVRKAEKNNDGECVSESSAQDC